MRTWEVVVTVKAPTKEDAVQAVIEFLNAGGDPDSITHEPDASEYDEQGSTLTPVVAILTIFVMAAVLIAQSGLVNALVARFAQVVR